MIYYQWCRVFVSLNPPVKVTKLTDTNIYDSKNKNFSKGP